MPSGMYERRPYMKNMKHDQTVKIEKMLEIGMSRVEICRALRLGTDTVARVIGLRNKRIQNLADGILLNNPENYD
jgi:DNA invertase Pin-like site-specific DNA recombinase